MADALAIVGVIAVAAQSVKEATAFVESIRGAPAIVQRLVDDLKALTIPLENLSKLSSDSSAFDVSTRAEIDRCLSPVLQRCQQTVDEVQRMLVPFVRQDGSANRRGWKRMAWIFRDQKVDRLRSQLDMHKSTLSLVGHCASAAMQTSHKEVTDKAIRKLKRLEQHFEIETSSAADTDRMGRSDQAEVERSIREWLEEIRSMDESQNDPECFLPAALATETDSWLGKRTPKRPTPCKGSPDMGPREAHQTENVSSSDEVSGTSLSLVYFRLLNMTRIITLLLAVLSSITPGLMSSILHEIMDMPEADGGRRAAPGAKDYHGDQHVTDSDHCNVLENGTMNFSMANSWSHPCPFEGAEGAELCEYRYGPISFSTGIFTNGYHTIVSARLDNPRLAAVLAAAQHDFL